MTMTSIQEDSGRQTQSSNSENIKCNQKCVKQLKQLTNFSIELRVEIREKLLFVFIWELFPLEKSIN